MSKFLDFFNFVEMLNCKNCKYFVICPHIQKKEALMTHCYYWVNQKEDFPKKEE